MPFPSDCPVGGTYYYDPSTINPSLNGWTVEQFLAQDSIISTGTAWRHFQSTDPAGGHVARNMRRALPVTPDYVELTVALNSTAYHSTDGLDSAGDAFYAHLRGYTSAVSDWSWSVGLILHSGRDIFPQITWRVKLVVYRNFGALYSQTLLDHRLLPGDIPYSFAAQYRVKVKQAAANILEFYVDDVLVYTSIPGDGLNLSTWVGGAFAQYFFAPSTYQIHTGYGSDFRAVKLGPGLPLTCIGQTPVTSHLLTESTGKISHARVTAENRGERDAMFAHQKLGSLT